MQLSQLKKRRERTLRVHLPHVIKDRKDIECLFTGNFYVKLPRQSSRSCHVVFSSMEEKIMNYKSAKGKTINGKRIVIQPLRALEFREKTMKIKKKKVFIPEIKPDIKVTQTIFVSNVPIGIKSDEIKGALPGCVQVTLLKAYNKDFRSAMAKMESIQIAAEYLKEKHKWPVFEGHKTCLKSDTRKKHKKRSFTNTLKIYNEDTIEELNFDKKAQTNNVKVAVKYN
ncbi:uncharacterized protein LOC112639643 [Camponotus floridanus]|uniref:uncharacterized protein LOC112639643 n=1 Tax=Camponotus floridanus TaxID=104421 RepID=UPI000DC67C62|nr:uncharacterized protein LOC112639643 [Camponotus floridanus]